MELLPAPSFMAIFSFGAVLRGMGGNAATVATIYRKSFLVPGVFQVKTQTPTPGLQRSLHKYLLQT